MISRITVEVGLISRSRRLRLIILTKTLIILDIANTVNLIIVLLYMYIERIHSFSLWHKMFSKFVPTLSFPQVLSVFSLSRNQQTAPLPPSSIFCVGESLSSNIFSMSCSVNEEDLEVMFLLLHWHWQATRNHAPRSYMTWSPVQGGKMFCTSFCASFIAGSRRAFLCVVLTVFDSLFVCHWETECSSKSLFTFVWFLFFVTWKLLWTRNNQC